MSASTARILLVGAVIGIALCIALSFLPVTDVPAESNQLLLALVAAFLVAVALFLPSDRKPPEEDRTEPPVLPAAPPVTEAIEPPQPDPGHVDIESLAEPMILVDGQRVIRANAGARQLLGERIVGSDVRVGLRHPVILEALAQSRELARPAIRELMGLGRPENVFRLRAVHLGDERTLLALADITQARLTERMRVDFVANASHELRTPLATLLGFIETLQGPAAEDEPARARFLDIMGREAQRMSRLIDDLLSLSRIELDKYVHPRESVTLEPILADVQRTLAVRLQADERVLINESQPGLPSVVGDRDQILQVLHNLISNALKYGRTGTPILLKVERQLPRAPRTGEPMLKVSVTDEGEGIAPEHLPRLTERFYRVDTSRSRKMGGTGLGLAIVKHIVERHRGELMIESRPALGTTVSFTLPEAAADLTESSDGEPDENAESPGMHPARLS